MMIVNFKTLRERPVGRSCRVDSLPMVVLITKDPLSEGIVCFTLMLG